MTFTRPNNFDKLQVALGHDPDHDWMEDERRKLLAGLTWFTETFEKAGGKSLPITPRDALLAWLKVYPFSQLASAQAELLCSLPCSKWWTITSWRCGPLWNDPT